MRKRNVRILELALGKTYLLHFKEINMQIFACGTQGVGYFMLERLFEKYGQNDHLIVTNWPNCLFWPVITWPMAKYDPIGTCDSTEMITLIRLIQWSLFYHSAFCLLSQHLSPDPNRQCLVIWSITTIKMFVYALTCFQTHIFYIDFPKNMSTSSNNNVQMVMTCYTTRHQ